MLESFTVFRARLLLLVPYKNFFKKEKILSNSFNVSVYY